MTHAQRSILLVAMSCQGIAVGQTIGLLPILLEPLESAFQAPRTTIAAGQILIMLALTFSSILTGVLLDRGGVRRVMLTGAACLVVAQLLASFATSLPLLGLAALLAGAAVPSIGPLTAGKLVTHYFDEGRGRAMGLMSIGPPLGSGLFAALAGWLLGEMDWAQSLRVLAAIAALGLFPMILRVVPRRFEDVPPEHRGLPAIITPTAGERGTLNVLSEAGERAASDATPTPARAPSMFDVFRSPAFLWAGSMFALVTGISSAWTVHAAAYLGGFGLDEAARSNVMALQFWMGVPGSVLCGALAERIGVTRLLGLVLAAATLCYVGFAMATSAAVVTMLAGFGGFAVGGVLPLYLMLLGLRVGPDALGRSIGLSNLMMLPVMSVAVLFAAAVFEAQASYAPVLWVFAVGLFGSLLCLLGGRSSGEHG
jgi:MFS family permease